MHAAYSQPVKIDLNKKLDPKQKTIETFNFDAQRFRKTKSENPPTCQRFSFVVFLNPWASILKV